MARVLFFSLVLAALPHCSHERTTRTTSSSSSNPDSVHQSGLSYPDSTSSKTAFPLSIPLLPVSHDSGSTSEPTSIAPTVTSHIATSKISVSPVRHGNSGLQPKLNYSIVAISEQTESEKSFTPQTPHQSRGHIITEASLDKKGLEDEEKGFLLDDVFVIDSVAPMSSNTQGKLSGPSSANLQQAPLETDQFQTDKDQTQSVPDVQATESSAPSSTQALQTIHQQRENVKVMPAVPGRYGVFGPVTHKNLNGGPCSQGQGPCVIPTITYGTLLLWKDLSRTLAFAWELHVYGSAGLFLLLSCVAVLGMVGGSAMLRPLCGNLILANGLLLLTGALRTALLLTDPYGTRRILSRTVLTALYNLPLPLMLWAQLALAMIAHKGANLKLLASLLQRPRVVGSLAVLHCTLLLGADLLSPALTPELPLALQSLSLCWGLLLCLGILAQSLSRLHPFSKSPIPQWGTPQRTEERARRVTAVCALLGALCSSTQIYSLLWLYGLLGDWRRFSWGWWLGQFWARVLELFWGFSMLVLGSWAFWTPRRSQARCHHHQRKPTGSLFWGTVQKALRAGPFSRSEKNWAELMPNNWAGQHPSKADRGSILRVYDDPSTIDSLRDTMTSPHYAGVGPTAGGSGTETHLLWQQLGEQECVLSFIEFDMRPPSPINLSLSIDNALQREHRHLLGLGSLFTGPLPSSWTHQARPDTSLGDSDLTPASSTCGGFGSGLASGSRSATPDHFRGTEQPEPQSLEGHDQILQLCPNPDHQTRKAPDTDVYRFMVPDEVKEPGITKEENWGSVGSMDAVKDL
ncbi:hypothetical protein UPYG_G00165350 [Umbra pygmaea]|uniref:Proline-rich transmembrane protein 3/4 domain-containing protein n=1 Tax=Umbra pygmaea TaxID=75934 RepID=A0ABD0WSD9_UMBPY